jgi:hypothetical protein
VEINYRTYQQINKEKWDACITIADNGLIYAYSFYLDAMAKNWDALILNDYEAVMPLTWNKKHGIHYLYQPAFTACLGIFGKSLTAEKVATFLKMVPSKFKYWDIYFNPGNLFKIAGVNLYERNNYVLNLAGSYEEIYNAYRNNIKRNIKKSEQLHLFVKKNISVMEIIMLTKEYTKSLSQLKETDFTNFEGLYHVLYQKDKATTYGVFTKENELIASAVFFFSHGRAYYILVGNHPNGKTLGASHALINAFIKDHAGQNLLLDFEGSDIPSLAFFYGSFGAVLEKYSAVNLNKLPAPVKWLKK